MFETEKLFIDKFSYFYNKSLDNKSNILKLFAHKIQNVQIKSRRIFCPTAMYKILISMQQHVESHIVREHDYWNQIITQLYKPRKTHHKHLFEFIAHNELMDLNEGIIPYFYRKDNDRHLYHMSGAVYYNAYENTLEQELIEHINNLPDPTVLMSYIIKSYDSVRELKTSSDLEAILEYHEKKRIENNKKELS